MANVSKLSAKENPGASVNATGAKSNVFLSHNNTAKRDLGATFFWDHTSHSVEPIRELRRAWA